MRSFHEAILTFEGIAMRCVRSFARAFLPALLVSIQVAACGSSEQVSRSDRRGDSFVLTEKELQALPYTSVDQILIGRIPGARSTSAGLSEVRVRGPHSMRGTNEPLYVVDGIRAAAAARLLNPHDLSRIEVLRGPSAIAKYGAEAVNGVIIIETKRAPARN